MSKFTESGYSLRVLGCAVMIPFLTGFAEQAHEPPGAPLVQAATLGRSQAAVPDPAAGRPERTTVQATQPQQAEQQPPVAVTNEPVSYNWRRSQPRGIFTAAAATPDAPGAAAVTDGTQQRKVLDWNTGANKSRWIPAGEVIGFLTLLNLFDRTVYHDDYTDGKRTYASDFSSTWEHLSRQNWEFDKDPFNVNQFGHPYQGATMYGIARSSGLGFWESWAYSNVGSFLWKMAGETDRPSINDMITTGNSGSLLGEALFRMSQLVLKEQPGQPDVWHELGAAIVSPPTAFNRYAFGDRFKTPFPSHDPATFWRFRLGSLFDHEKDATLDFQMSYGLPGQPGYSYQRPLDYFDFQISGIARQSNPVGNVLLRGLLYGKEYDAGDDYRGIWGIYGSYDYISPTIFRVSTTALSVGTTAQYWMAPGVALQGTVLGGAGFGAAGHTPTADGQRDYHYGFTPQGMIALKLLFGTRFSLETVLRGYLVTGTGSDYSEGTEAIMRSNTNVTFRIFKRHGISLQYIEAIRDAKYGNLPTRHQTDGTVGIFYTFLGDSHLGAVEWRDFAW